MAELNVVTLNSTNFRDPVATLRTIADEMEAGDFGEVGCVGVVVMGDKTWVYGAGIDSEAPSVAALLYAGFSKLIGAINDRP